MAHPPEPHQPSTPARAAIRQGIQVLTFAEADDAERRYWWGRSPIERLKHVECLRQMNYGSQVIGQGLQRVLAVIERPRR